MEMLIGSEGLEKLRNSKVAVFGVGGVGSFVAEALVRAAIGTIVLIDMDDIAITNINRQLHATSKTIGKSKVDVMKHRLLEINPMVDVEAYNETYNSESADHLLRKDYSYVVDAIDMVSSKIDLVVRCKGMGIPIISCMGAGNKLNPAMMEVADIYSTSVCPLAKVMRRELRKREVDELKVIYSKEPPMKPNLLEDNCCHELKNEDGGNTSWVRRNTPGSVSFVPPVAGFIMASELVKDILGM